MRCSVVVPCHDEEQSLPELHRRLATVLPAVADEHEILLVDDGSTDGTAAVMHRLADADGHVRCVRFSRNFGQEAALAAGLDRATGDCVVLMDADLQDPPELIPDLVARWREGDHEVHVVRRQRTGIRWARRAAIWLSYRLIHGLSDVGLPLDTGNFRLLDRRVVDQLNRLREQGRSLRGLVPWVGFRQSAVVHRRPPRFAGRSKYGLRQLTTLALDLVMGQSVTPLRLASLTGMAVAAACVVVGLVVLAQRVFWAVTPRGYALTATGLFFLGGIHLMLLGIIGEYLARVARQTRGRPLYIIREEGGPARPAERPGSSRPTPAGERPDGVLRRGGEGV